MEIMKYDIERMQEVYAETNSLAMVAKIFKCSKGTASNYLSPGQREKTLVRANSQRRYKQSIVDSAKAGIACLECKREGLELYLLDLDHVNGEKIASISEMIRMHSEESLRKEILKCQVLCSRCHRIVTERRKVEISGNFSHLTNHHSYAWDDDLTELVEKEKLLSGVKSLGQTIVDEQMVTYLKILKERHGCTDCKESFAYPAMDFDHITSNKIDDISTMARMGNPLAVFKEIEKCEIVCSECHRKRSKLREI